MVEQSTGGIMLGRARASRARLGLVRSQALVLYEDER